MTCLVGQSTSHGLNAHMHPALQLTLITPSSSPVLSSHDVKHFTRLMADLGHAEHLSTFVRRGTSRAYSCAPARVSATLPMEVSMVLRGREMISGTPCIT